MHRFQTMLIAATIALTVAGATTLAAGSDQSGQTQTGSQGQTQPPPQTTPPQTAPPPTTPPQTQQGQVQGQRDEAAARAELQQAKQALTDLIALPETSKLNADARAAVNQVITSFNNLVTAENNWFERYQEVQRSLTPVLGPDPSDPASSTGASGTTGTSGTTGASGTAGSTGVGATIDVPAPLKDRLTQFRQHMQAFARAAGAPAAGTSVGTSGTSAPDPASSGAQGGETMQEHFDAISDLLQQALSGQTATGTSGTSTTGATGTSGTSTSSASGTVTVDRATLQQMQAHLQKLRELSRVKGIR